MGRRRRNNSVLDTAYLLRNRVYVSRALSSRALWVLLRA